MKGELAETRAAAARREPDNTPRGNHLPVFPEFNRVKSLPPRPDAVQRPTTRTSAARSICTASTPKAKSTCSARSIQPGDVVIEVGANIGPHTVFLAQHVGPQGLVLAFEPQRILFQTLCANLALNSIHQRRLLPAGGRRRARADQDSAVRLYARKQLRRAGAWRSSRSASKCPS